MAYLPDAVPEPELDEINGPFWSHCNAQRLVFQQCADCGHRVHPPLPVCPACQSIERAWVDAPAAARVYSFVWVHTAAHDSVKDALPYNVVLVEFPGLPGVRMLSNVVGTRRGELKIGDALALVWERQGGQWLPRFARQRAS